MNRPNSIIAIFNNIYLTDYFYRIKSLKINRKAKIKYSIIDIFNFPNYLNKFYYGIGGSVAKPGTNWTLISNIFVKLNYFCYTIQFIITKNIDLILQ